MNQPLYQKFDTLAEMGMLKHNIPSHITTNLNTNLLLRPYQKEAFTRFFHYMTGYPEKLTPIHLLFNMATGSGKTLIMAGLILHLYQEGHRNFLFFVNSNNIINKTKQNFLDTSSSKHLFNQNLHFDDKKIAIEEIQNFEATNQDNINICFTTIQKLHSDLHNEKENALTFEDFKNKKIVLISDEAHHIQASTKKKKQPTLFDSNEIENTKPSWENTVEKIFFQNNDNLLLEFTATIDDQNKAIQEKYAEKIIYKYDLKNFRNDKYSKDVHILQSDFDKQERILQALILSQYRQEIASKYHINIKPVILFKAQQTIEESKNNELLFHDIIANLDEECIKNIKYKTSVSIIQKAFGFFEREKMTTAFLIKKLQQNFAPNKCLNVNEGSLDKKSLKKSDKQAVVSQQYLLNSLEDTNNQIRAIFAVQKLNEGWDVLNLFDIVRLYTSRDFDGGKAGKTTTAEAQLIGRGARYFPFIYEDKEKYMRKFDNDITHDLRILEELHYHSISDSRYISEIRKTLIQEGIMDDHTVQKELLIKHTFKKTDLYKTGHIYLNTKIKNQKVHPDFWQTLPITQKDIEYTLSTGAGESKALFHEKDFTLQNQQSITTHTYNIKDIYALQPHVVYKALHKNPFFTFKNIAKHFENHLSMKSFIESKEFKNLNIKFKGKENEIQLNTIHNKHLLLSLSMMLRELEKHIKATTFEYKGSEEFKPHQFKEVFIDKTLNIDEQQERANGQEELVGNKDWYVQNANYGTDQEKKFVSMMNDEIAKFQKAYEHVYLVRNEQHAKIFAFEDGRGFAPDFLLFLQKKEDTTSITYQIFIEPKGHHLKDHDKWKRDFLEQIKEKHKDTILTFNDSKHYTITGIPHFYNSQEENDFKQELFEVANIRP